MNNHTPLLKIQGLTKRFGGLIALSSLDLEISGPSIVSIIGPNGAGKTTVFNCISGAFQVEAGKIFLKGQDILPLKPHERSRLGIARTFQNIRLFNNMSVLENVLVGMHTRLKSGFLASVLKDRGNLEEETRAQEKALELLSFVGLKSEAHRRANLLPYGDQRRLELARALALEPTLLLLDEPTAGMNPSETKEMMALIKKVFEDLGVCILLIEHDMRVVMEISQRIVVLDFGHKIAEGSPEEIRTNERVIRAYLGTRWKVQGG